PYSVTALPYEIQRVEVITSLPAVRIVSTVAPPTDGHCPRDPAHEHLPSGLDQTTADVLVVEVELVALVEAARPVERGAARQHGAQGQQRDLVGTVRACPDGRANQDAPQRSPQ